MIRIFNLINNPLFSGSVIMMVGSTAINALSYLFHLIMGRLLGPASYGELASLISLSGLLGVIPASAGLVVIKYISAAKTEEEKKVLVNWFRRKIFIVSFIFFVLMLILSPFIKSFLHLSKIIYVVAIATTLLFSLPALFNRSILQGLLKFKEMVITTIIEFVVKLVGSILLIYVGYRVGGVMIALVISVVIGYYLTTLYLKSLIKTNLQSPSNIRSMILYSIPVIIQSIALTSLYSSDLVLVKHFFSSHDAGIYSALSTLGKIIFFGIGPISAVMFPMVAQRFSKGGDYKKVFIYSFLITLFFATGVLLIYWLFPQFAVSLLYGQSYLEASPLLIWFGIFITLFTLSSLLISFYLSLGHTRVVLLPAIAAIAQILVIWFYHESLFTIIKISIWITALLLVFLLIYSVHNWNENKKYKFSVSHSPGI